MNIKSMSRFRASGVHFLGSVFVALLAAALVFLFWYPGGMAAASGVTGIFLMMLGVDVMLGPCMTLIVFNPSKKELRRDLLVVLLMQVAALLYGMHAVFIARPVYAVFNVDRFDLVFANELSAEKLAKVVDARFKRPPLLGPEIIAARRPDTAEARNEIMFGALAGGADLPQMPQYYVPYVEKQRLATQKLRPLVELRSFNASESTRVDALVARYAARPAGFVPLKGAARDLAVVLARDTGEVLEIVVLAPWQ